MLRSVARFYVLAARQGVLAQRTAPAIGKYPSCRRSNDFTSETRSHEGGLRLRSVLTSPMLGIFAPSSLLATQQPLFDHILREILKSLRNPDHWRNLGTKVSFALTGSGRSRLRRAQMSLVSKSNNHSVFLRFQGVRSFSAHKEESHAEIDAHYEAYFKRPEIDGWEIRKGLVEIQKRDMIPNPQICDAILRACRRVNDYALTTRFLEALKLKCTSEPALHDYILKEIAPTMAELGISTVEELGYDKPELWLQYYDD